MRKKDGPAVARSVDEYLEWVPEDQRAALERLRKLIRSAAPAAEETISYQIPAYKYHGSLVFFAAFTAHCSFFVVNKNILTRYAKELESFRIAGATIQFQANQPLPAALVKRIVKDRLRENEGRKKAQPKPKNKS